VTKLTKTEKILFSLLGLSVAIIILGILFLLNAMQDMTNPDNIAFFPSFCAIDNVLAKGKNAVFSPRKPQSGAKGAPYSAFAWSGVFLREN